MLKKIITKTPSQKKGKTTSKTSILSRGHCNNSLNQTSVRRRKLLPKALFTPILPGKKIQKRMSEESLQLLTSGDEGFDHRANESITHLIHEEDDLSSTIRSLQFHPSHAEDKNYGQGKTICSSCRGIILVYDWSASDYCICNPFTNRPMKHLPPLSRTHNPLTSIAVLSVTPPSDFDVVLLKGPNQKEHDGETYTTYEADIYSGSKDSWACSIISNKGIDHIIPNTFVSAYDRETFCLCDNFVVKLNIVDGTVDHLSYPVTSIIDPQRVQLGRIENILGLAIINNEKLEIYKMVRADGPGYLTWTNYLKVQLQRGSNNLMGFSASPDMLSIKCRSMPILMRFESFKLQLLLLIDGNLVILESTNNHSSAAINFRLRNLGRPPIQTYCFVRALPYSSNSNIDVV